MKTGVIVLIILFSVRCGTLSRYVPSADVNEKCPCKTWRWRAVDMSMVQGTVHKGATLVYQQTRGKLVIRGTVTRFGCGGPGSAAITYIRGDWTRIMYTQEFRGTASCWKIFGGTSYPKYDRHTIGWGNNPGITNDVEDFSEADGDAIFSEHKMNSDSSDTFDGKVRCCDHTKQNFWDWTNGQGLRSATVMLRRGNNRGKAGISTETSCGTPTFVIKDIYVYM